MSAHFHPDKSMSTSSLRTFSEYLTSKRKMVAKRRGKRKTSSKSKGYVFEVSDEDFSPVNSDNERDQRESKVLKTDSTLFVESVVNALSNLENEKTETKATSLQKFDDLNVEVIKNVDSPIEASRNVNENDSSEILGCQSPDARFENCEEKTQVEDGELGTENSTEFFSNQTINIHFSSKELSKLYKSRFINFLSSFVELDIIKEDELSITLQKDKNEWNVLDESFCVDNTNLLEESTSNALNKKKKKKKAKKEKDLFILDTTPSQHENPNSAKYKAKFNIDLNDGNDEDDVKMSSNQICFNCEQAHSLRDCTLPKDYGKINMMRQKFKKDKQTSRYHLEEDQKYAHLTPGKISSSLRDALGIKANQLPPYVYQMRNLGYPPGWLAEAKFVYSNLALFDSDGNNVKPENSKKNQSLDINKIIEYEGFNAPMDKNCKDEYRQFRVSPYSEKFSKEAMIKYFEQEYSKQQDDFETQDMEIEINEENSITEKLSTQTSSLKTRDKNVPSPSLVDLETQKLDLLAALEDSSSNIKSEENIVDVSLETSEVAKEPADSEPVEPLPDADEALSKMFPTKEDTPTDILDVTSDRESPIFEGSSIKTVLTSSFGTPILKSNSPYSRLPNLGNFVKDVCPVINFENLPNSTGKYEQMTGLLQKVRNTMKHLQKHDSS